MKLRTLSIISMALMLNVGCNSGGSSGVSIEAADTAASDTNTETIDEATETTITTDIETLGGLIYNDDNLSSPPGQSCASCHTIGVGFDDPDSGDPTSLGADGSSIGNRNSPTTGYAALIPEPQTVTRTLPDGTTRQAFIGGQFLDGRADTLEEQAKGPFLNPVEMNNASKEDVVALVRASSYASDFESIFGAGSLDDAEIAYDLIADAIAAFERTETFSPFSSKFDQVQNGTNLFTLAEARGERLFNGKAQCILCHNTVDIDEQLFSDFEFRNIGVPANPTLITMLGPFIDNGRGDVTGRARDNGRFRTTTLRNIAITAPYMHNGIFTSLTEVVEFYNTRDTTFPDPPEVSDNVDDFASIGELGLTNNEIVDIVAFLETLTDQ